MERALGERFSLAGRVAMVSGASSGIGRHMAGVLARAGADVILLARRADALAHAVEQINQAGQGRAHALTGDVAALDTLPGLAVRAAEPFGPPAILITMRTRREPGAVPRIQGPTTPKRD
jgi:gluconate 5-dehydrogenase